MICGSGGSKSRLAKAAGAEPCGQMREEKLHALWREAYVQVKKLKTPHVRISFGSWDVEKLHAVVARSTCGSQNVQSTPGSDHFWKLRCRKSARRCGAKHISKSKVLKTEGFGALLDVQMSFLRGRHKGLCTLSKVSKTCGFCSNFNYNHRYATLHYATLHYATLRYTTLHYTPLNYNYNYNCNCNCNYNYDYNYNYNYCTYKYKYKYNYTYTYTSTTTTTTWTTTTTRHDTTLRYATLHRHYTNYTTLRYTPLHFTTLHSITLHYNYKYSYNNYNYNYNYITRTLRYAKLITLHRLHCTTPHSATLHYTPLTTTTTTTTTAPH